MPALRRVADAGASGAARSGDAGAAIEQTREQATGLARRDHGLDRALPDAVSGAISFEPKGESADANGLNDDTRCVLIELNPMSDQVTIANNSWWVSAS